MKSCFASQTQPSACSSDYRKFPKLRLVTFCYALHSSDSIDNGEAAITGEGFLKKDNF